MEMRFTTFRLSYALLLPLFSAFASLQALNTPPQVECLESAMRLHFVPGAAANDGASLNSSHSFCGHIYVKGFFFSTRCHLSFVRIHVDRPFFFHVPYESDCQVTRERVQREPSHNDSASSGFRYSTVVIVQHHPLFVTDRDRAYGVSCFYNDERHTFQQQLRVGNLPTIPLTGVDRLPTCSYKILPMANSSTNENESGGGVVADAFSTQESVKFANIGDALVHRWRCDTDGSMGILVHSCVVRDGIGGQYLLLDERGCATDPSLMGTPRYVDALDASDAPMDAFKFAEQMVVQFACQITLCERRENGCEGITPPTCNFSAPTAPIREVLSRQDIANSADGRGGYEHLMSTLHSGQSLLSAQNVDGLASATASPSAVSSVTERWTSNRADGDTFVGGGFPSVNLFGNGGSTATFASSRHARSAQDALSTGPLGRRREFSAAFMGRGFSENVVRDVDAAESALPLALPTLNVSAERLIIFTDDEKADGLTLGGPADVSCKSDAASSLLLFLLSALTLLLSASLVVLGTAFAHHLRREISIHHDQRKPTSGMGGRFLQRLALKHRRTDPPNAGLDNPIALYQVGASSGRTVGSAATTTFANDPMSNNDYIQRVSRPCYTAAVAAIVASSRHRSTSEQQLVVG